MYFLIAWKMIISNYENIIESRCVSYYNSIFMKIWMPFCSMEIILKKCSLFAHTEIEAQDLQHFVKQFLSALKNYAQMLCGSERQFFNELRNCTKILHNSSLINILLQSIAYWLKIYLVTQKECARHTIYIYTHMMRADIRSSLNSFFCVSHEVNKMVFWWQRA